nr:YciI family protein [uncultured Lichenicoccus sp.]
MKVVAVMNYNPYKEKTKSNWPAHLLYREGFLQDGRLRAAGPFDDESGSLWTLEVETIEEAEKIVKGDPLIAAGICVSWKLYPLGPVVVSPVEVPIRMSEQHQTANPHVSGA